MDEDLLKQDSGPRTHDEESLMSPLVVEEPAKADKKILFWSVFFIVISLLAAAMICVGVIPSRTLDSSRIPLNLSAVRTYYIAVVEVNHSYTAGGEDVLFGPLTGTYVQHSADPSHLEGYFIKAQYVEYTDESFTVC
jgi:hypothetical protein